MDIVPGQVVYSKAGRDEGNTFIIVNVINETRVQVSDGDLRRIETPKLKNIKHLELTDEVIVSLNEKIKKKEKVTNAEIRKTLEEFHNLRKDDNNLTTKL